MISMRKIQIERALIPAWAYLSPSEPKHGGRKEREGGRERERDKGRERTTFVINIIS